MTTPLILAATRAEAAYVPPQFTVVVVGLGKTAAAAATTRAVLEHQPTE
ncbi:MAG: nucleosidase, partial [Myxococcales bacterium]